MTIKTVLSRKQIEQIAIYMQLNQNYDMVMIIEKHTSGIGAHTWARFFKSNMPDRYYEMDVTDIDTW